MPGSPVDSAIYGKLFGDAELAALLSDSAEMRAMMLVEGALAKVQGALGLIPETAAGAIHRASLELQLDPSGLGVGVAANAVPVPGLVTAFREAMQAPEHAHYLHWGATSQDIMDTGLALRLRQALTIMDGRLAALTHVLADLAEAEATQPMIARTYGQAAVVTSFGARVASWGSPLMRHRARLASLRVDVECVSLSGAAGTLSAMGDKGPEVRAGLAEALGLTDPGGSWHSTRDGIAALSGWLTALTGSLGKMGEDLLILSQSGIDEVALAGGGASSTMPQKANPVAPSALVAIARMAVGLNSVLYSSLPHRQERDGAAWMSEWLSLGQLLILTGRALSLGEEIARGLAPKRENMSRHIAATHGTIFAEALSFALAGDRPRPEAQALTKRMIAEALETRRPLPEVAAECHPELDLSTVFSLEAQLGTAPSAARAFAEAVRAEGVTPGAVNP